MRLILVSAMIGAMIACGGGSTPTAPTPVAAPAPVPPPVVVAPPVVAPNPLLSDPRFSLSFYRQFALNGFESPAALRPLFRQREAPRIYLRTIHANGSPMDAFTLNETAAALINTTGSMTGVFGLAGLELGTGTRAGQPGWITVAWLDDPERKYCGYAGIGSDWIELYTNTPGCRCSGGPAVRLRTVKHELGHALGFWHTDARTDLMSSSPTSPCDQSPSEREVFHARIAYEMPLGSLDPR